MLYLGKSVADGRRFEIKANHLTTHGLCVGMTGSGKTGLCIDLIEELRLAGVPTLILDPKGDMTNLLLSFPSLSAGDFKPWLEAGQAEKEGVTLDELAEKTAARWREGLAEAGLGAGQIEQMQQRCPAVLYTPGSTAALPLNVLSVLERPETDDVETQGELIKTAVGALLGLIGVSSDPLTGREFILLSNIVDFCWDNGQPASLERIIAYVQDPPMKRLGVFAVDAFFPPDRRVELALKLNGLLASPAFALWRQGAPLNIDALLWDEQKRPRCCVLYLAHLNENERMFVIALVASRLVAWMKRQAGSENLRALLFIDEVMGLMPPHPANPPSKTALVTLYKQARAFGLGVVVATQNPMDIDYKVFSNAGLWMVGRLSTDNDRRRVLDGLRGLPGLPDDLPGTLAGLGKRQFFVRNVHATEPAVVGSRFAMSFLRGPLTKEDLTRLPQTASAAAAPEPVAERVEGLFQPPNIAGVERHFLAPEALRDPEWLAVFRAGGQHASSPDHTLYAPALYVACQVRYDDTKAQVLYDETVSRVIAGLDALDRLPAYEDDETPRADLAPFFNDFAPPNARFLPLPSWLDDPAEFEQAQRQFVDYILRSKMLPLFVNRELKMYSRPGENEEQFSQRCAELADERAKEQLEKVQARFQTKLTRLEDKRRRLGGKLDDKRQEAGSRDMESMTGMLESAAGFLFGRRRSIGRAVSSTMRSRRMAQKAHRRHEQLADDLAALEADIENLHDEMAETEEKIYAEFEEKAQRIEPYPVPAERADIRPLKRAIIWAPLR
ncbi:MAG TPA: DUF853 family protein [bacterium]|nr:DUF853 family protein [bacterium]